MQFEKIRRVNKSKIIIGGVISLGVIGAVTILPSFAKYRLTDSINIANGVVNYKVPDFNIVAMYKSEDKTNYTEVIGRMPDSGYIINESKSYCNLNGSKDTNAILKTTKGIHGFSNLIKGDKCYLYFDKLPTVENIIESFGPAGGDTSILKSGIPNFNNPATGLENTANNGIYKTTDGMYGGDTYYWRGAVNNNYVKFAGFCWRIIRINGDKTIRLIYDGEYCHANGTSTTESLAITNQSYNTSYNQANYVGWTYSGTSQRTTSGTSSNVKNQTESWFNTNLKHYTDKVADGRFCNNRNVQSGSTWAVETNFYYEEYTNVINKTPSFTCPNGDMYILKVGAITASEAMFAGANEQINKSYYLYNGYSYWTISPYQWYKDNKRAFEYFVETNGCLDGRSNAPRGIRPVINLKADTTFSSGDGTLNAPYEVL